MWTDRLIHQGQLTLQHHHHHHHHWIFDQHAGTGATSTSEGPLPGSWLAARMADLTSMKKNF